ncbi:MAG: type II toxin-antitoxin system HigB family toxin [Beijerinckiaceae bacterium]
MRLIARKHLEAFAERHPDALVGLSAWRRRVRLEDWRSTNDVMMAYSKAKALNGERVRFEIQGGKYRLIAAFDFRRGIAFVKFIGTHAEYDTIDALSISIF